MTTTSTLKAWLEQPAFRVDFQDEAGARWCWRTRARDRDACLATAQASAEAHAARDGRRVTFDVTEERRT